MTHQQPTKGDNEMAGNRKHGFARGNRAGRNGAHLSQPWFCDGCNKEHGRAVFRTKFLDGKSYCEKTYYNAREDYFKSAA